MSGGSSRPNAQPADVAALRAARWRDVPIASFDLEMTGLDPKHDRVCELAVVRSVGGRVVDTFEELVRAPVASTDEARTIHGIDDDALAAARPFAEVWGDARARFEGAILASHNAWFDLDFLRAELEHAAVPGPFEPVVFDTLLAARRLFAFPRNNLSEVAHRLGVPDAPGHRALADARVTHQVVVGMLDALDPHGDLTVGALLDLIDALAPNTPLRLAQRVTLRDAIASKRTVYLAYQSASGPVGSASEREVGPWRVDGGAVQGFCFLRGTDRVFKMDRVRSIRPGGRSFSASDGVAARKKGAVPGDGAAAPPAVARAPDEG